MAIKFEKIKPGMTLYDVRKANWRSRMFRPEQKWEHWPVQVIEVNAEERKVLASWNHNKPQWMDEVEITHYRVSLPRADA